MSVSEQFTIAEVREFLTGAADPSEYNYVPDADERWPVRAEHIDNDYWANENSSKQDWPRFGRVETVEQVGGEGEGDRAHVVVKFLKTGQFFRCDGYYSSYEGAEYDGQWFEVKPKLVQVTRYEA